MGTNARFHRAVGIDVDSQGNIYVADAENRRIRKITSDGVVSTVAGNGRMEHADGPALDASFIRPAGIAVGVNEEVYVLDYAQKVRNVTVYVRKLTADGQVSTVATIP
jgi:hypothetical protein